MYNLGSGLPSYLVYPFIERDNIESEFTSFNPTYCWGTLDQIFSFSMLVTQVVFLGFFVHICIDQVESQGIEDFLGDGQSYSDERVKGYWLDATIWACYFWAILSGH